MVDFIATLRGAGISRVIDVRQLPISRRKGFAKSALSMALAEAGIDYIHFRGLGDPKKGREAARAGDVRRFRAIFANHLRTKAAQADLKIAANLAAAGGACLLCYERDHSTCHRTMVAEAISGSIAASIRHLGVRAGFAAHNHSVARSPAEARA